MKKSENLVTLLVIADCLYGAVQTGSLLEQRLVIRDGSTTGGGKMKKPVDIFWFGESGPVWVEAAQTMERAKACVDASPLKTSGGYVVVDHRTGNSMSFEPNLRNGRRSGWRIEKATSSRIK
jgi:hypothetical protein